MAVSKRLRYEIFRRDAFCCRYCGEHSSPTVKLTIDHVTPTTLGGDDVPLNLVTACEPCNSGKTSSTVDASFVEEVSESTARWIAALHASTLAALTERDELATYVRDFVDTWNEAWAKHQPPVGPNWQQTVEHFYSRRLPIEILQDAVWISARSSPTVRDKFLYCMKVAWNKLGQIEADARAMYDQPVTATEDHPPLCWICAHPVSDDDLDGTYTPTHERCLNVILAHYEWGRDLPAARDTIDGYMRLNLDGAAV